MFDKIRWHIVAIVNEVQAFLWRHGLPHECIADLCCRLANRWFADEDFPRYGEHDPEDIEEIE